MQTEAKLRLADVFVSITDPQQSRKVDLVELLARKAPPSGGAFLANSKFSSDCRDGRLDVHHATSSRPFVPSCLPFPTHGPSCDDPSSIGARDRSHDHSTDVPAGLDRDPEQ